MYRQGIKHQIGLTEVEHFITPGQFYSHAQLITFVCASAEDSGSSTGLWLSPGFCDDTTTEWKLLLNSGTLKVKGKLNTKYHTDVLPSKWSGGTQKNK